MIVSIHQPCYLPWLGYFDKIARSDIHVVLDTVQFEKNSFTNRNKIKTSQGWCWLTVPVMTKGKYGRLSLTTLHIDNTQNWQSKHFKSIIMNYKNAPFFDRYIESLKSFYEEKHWTFLGKLNIEMLKYFLSILGINTKIVMASSIKPDGKKSDLILNICRNFGATEYISGELGRNYLNEESFTDAGINVFYQEYHHPVYHQLFEEFQPYMAIIDLLMNCGDESKNILMGSSE